ncbi:MAG: methyltransferase domain-containing protein [bacterium]|nr:methyltransferase domain-containing protein [bacterium]
MATENYSNIKILERITQPRDLVSEAFISNMQSALSRLPGEGEVLEVGSGLGELRRQAHPSLQQRMTHLEQVEDYVRYMRDMFPDAKVLRGNLTRLDFGDNTFSGYIGLSTFSTVEKLEEAIAEAYRVLKPGGVFVHIQDISPLEKYLVKDLFRKDIVAIPTERLADENGELISARVIPKKDFEDFNRLLRSIHGTDDVLDFVIDTIQRYSSCVDVIGPEMTYDLVTNNPEVLEEVINSLELLKILGNSSIFPGTDYPISTLFERRVLEVMQEANFIDTRSESLVNTMNVRRPKKIINAGKEVNMVIRNMGTLLYGILSGVGIDEVRISSVSQCITGKK